MLFAILLFDCSVLADKYRKVVFTKLPITH